MSRRDGGTLVLGLGNPLMGDDGLGIVALERLRAHWTFSPPVELLDGGTWGMNLLHRIEAVGRLLLLDAIDLDEPPGTLLHLERDQLPRLFSMKVSPHQIDMREVLALAELRGRLPAATSAMGIQPERLELSTALSATVAAGVDALVVRARNQLAEWGHVPAPIGTPSRVTACTS